MNFKYLKTSRFILGMVTGATVGVGMSVLFYELNEDRRKTTDPLLVKEENTSAREPDLPPEKKQVKKVQTPVADSDTSLVGDIDTSAVEITEVPDTVEVKKPILVKKDVLLLAMDLKPTNLDTSKTSAIDTLEQNLNIRKNQYNSYRLEIWQSPLGYEGYKTSGNRILLYGIDTVYNFQLTMVMNDLVLRTGKRQYLIERNSEFTPFKLYRK